MADVIAAFDRGIQAKRGGHEFADVAASLAALNIARHSGSTDPWTVEALESELRLINASLDDAYTHK